MQPLLATAALAWDGVYPIRTPFVDCERTFDPAQCEYPLLDPIASHRFDVEEEVSALDWATHNVSGVLTPRLATGDVEGLWVGGDSVDVGELGEDGVEAARQLVLAAVQEDAAGGAGARLVAERCARARSRLPAPRARAGGVELLEVRRRNHAFGTTLLITWGEAVSGTAAPDAREGAPLQPFPRGCTHTGAGAGRCRRRPAAPSGR